MVDFGVLLTPPMVLELSDWKKENWGVEDNAVCDDCQNYAEMIDSNTYQIIIDTEWDLPTKWYDNLISVCNILGVDVNGIYADEDMGGMCGEIVIEDGDAQYVEMVDSSIRNNIYVDLWGEDDYDEDDDDYEDDDEDY